MRAFGESGATTASGRPIAIEVKAMGSGEAVRAILSGELEPHVFSPASGPYIGVLNQARMSRPAAATGAGGPLAPAGVQAHDNVAPRGGLAAGAGANHRGGSRVGGSNARTCPDPLSCRRQLA